MIRLTLLWLFISFLALYAFKDWYKSLCGLILMMSIIEHPDMPKTIFNIQGLNPWNLVFAFVILAWLINRNKEGLSWDIPNIITLLSILYITIIFVGFFRMMADTSGISTFNEMMGKASNSTLGYWSELIIDSIKWVIPGILLFDGCRSRKRLTWGLLAILGSYFILAVLVIKAMPLGAITDGEYLQKRALKILSSNIGYHRVNLAMMLSGAFWAIFAFRELHTSKYIRLYLLLACCITFLGMVLTGGRMGYITWAGVGFLLCIYRWRKYLFVAPLLVILATLLVPGALDRMDQGFQNNNNSNPIISENEKLNTYEITSGRTLAWPYVIDKIKEAPFTGFGRKAMQNTGTSTEILIKYGGTEIFPHPHNAYLQWLMDNGLLGFLPIFIFYFLFTKYSFSLFKDSRNPVFISTGGVSLALIIALLIASFGSQTFYPREGAVGMWCAMGLTLRVYVERSKLIKHKHPDAHIDDFWRMAA